MAALVTGTIGILVAAVIVWLMRKDQLHASHGVGWIIVASGFAFLGFAPGVIDALARELNVAYPPVLGLTLGIAVLVVKILLMDIERSRIEMRNQRMIQRIAMLEAELRSNRKEQREKGVLNDKQ